MIRHFALAAFVLSSVITVSGQDSEKALQFFNDANYDSALFFVDRALETEPEELAALLKLKADILSYQNEIQTSIDFYRQAIAEIESSELRDLTLLSESYSGMAFSYGYMGLYNKAIENQRIGLAYAIRLENQTEISIGYFNLATYFTRLSRYDSAIKFIGKAYEIDLNAGDSSAISSDLNTLGFLYGRMEQYDKALDYHQQSIGYLKPSEKNKLASRYNNLGMMEMELGAFNDSESHLIKSFELHRELNDSLKMAQRRQNLSQLYSRMNLLAKSKIYAEEAIGYYERASNKFFESNGRIQLANIHEKMNNINAAIRETSQALKLAEETNNLNILVDGYRLLVGLHEKNNNKSLAFEALKKQKFYEDSVQSGQQLSAINDLELKFVTEQKEKEIQLLEISNQLTEANLKTQQRTIMLLAIGLVIFITAAIWIFISQKQKFRLKEELLSREADNLRFQINALLGTGDESIQVAMDDVNDKLKERLSEREFDILKLAITEKSNREIAQEVFVSVNTVKFHLKNIYDKLGVSNRKEALQFVIKE